LRCAFPWLKDVELSFQTKFTANASFVPEAPSGPVCGIFCGDTFKES
jgi:hypothetical protein